ncbi:hypothetical protein ACEWY4_011379 [Coilia grayii]|uniref:Thymopoietin b n=1 Tax=Coilia grayii TaxID=363190 RepID=A0ABD1K4L8_9TELE
MAEFLEDPSVLTKEKLKSELLANDVPLPSGEQKKEVYVQLYLKNLTALNKKIPPQDPFSSDDELPTPVVSNRTRSSGRKAARKTDKPRPDEIDISGLSDEDLKEQLLKHGIDAGPIVASTRRLYEKKLEKALDGSATVTQSPPEPTTLKADSSQNGNTNSVQDHYSDKEEEESAPAEPAPEPEPEPAPVPVVSKAARSRGKTPVTVRTSSRRQNKVEEKVAAAEETVVAEEDVLKEMFPSQAATPTGISATCRKPIYGAAGRPVKPLNLWNEDTLVQRRTTYTETSSSILQGRPTPAASPAQGSSRLGRCLSLLLRLLVLLTVVAAVLYAYQHVDSEHISYVRGLLESTGIPALIAGGDDTAAADESSA